jgi:hypothetical protein
MKDAKPTCIRHTKIIKKRKIFKIKPQKFAKISGKQ